jgi:hypothetical protein
VKTRTKAAGLSLVREHTKQGEEFTHIKRPFNQIASESLFGDSDWVKKSTTRHDYSFVLVVGNSSQFSFCKEIISNSINFHFPSTIFLYVVIKNLPFVSLSNS